MPRPPSDIGSSEVIRTDRPLFAGMYCQHCPARGFCGERGTDSACADPAEYDVNALHPACTPLASDQFSLPASIRKWSLPLLVGHSIPIVEEPAEGLPVFGVDLDIAVKRRSKVPPQRAVAFLFGHDKTLARLWRQRADLGRELAQRGYSAAVGPAYSNWDDCPPYHGLAAIAQSGVVATELARHLPTVPALIWRHRRDIQRQALWLAAGDTQALATDLGTADVSRGIEGLRILGRELTRLVGPVPTLVVHGVGTETGIISVVGAWPGHVVVASQMPAQVARSGCSLSADLAHRIPTPTLSREALLYRNVATFEAAIGRIVERLGGGLAASSGSGSWPPAFGTQTQTAAT